MTTHTIERNGIRYSGERRDQILQEEMAQTEVDYRVCSRDWRCWALYAQVALMGIAFIGGIYIIVKLAIILHWQLDASLI